MPPPRDLDFLPFDLEVGVGVACDLWYPCAKFCLPRPFGFRVRADVRDIRQTDDGRRSPLNAPARPTGRGHNNHETQPMLGHLTLCNCLSFTGFLELSTISCKIF